MSLERGKESRLAFSAQYRQYYMHARIEILRPPNLRVLPDHSRISKEIFDEMGH